MSRQSKIWQLSYKREMDATVARFQQMLEECRASHGAEMARQADFFDEDKKTVLKQEAEKRCRTTSSPSQLPS